MKSKWLLKSLFVVGLSIAMCGFSMQVSAEPFTSFDFSQSTGFLVDNTLVGTHPDSIGWFDYTSSPTAPDDAYNTIAWGAPYYENGGLKTIDPLFNPVTNLFTDFSGLRVIGMDGSVITGADAGGGWSNWGGWETITTLYHQNRAISVDSASLLSSVIYSELSVDGIMSPDPIPITFKETLNIAGTCEDPLNLGSVCPDKFTFPNVNFASIYFMDGPYQYEAGFQLANFKDSATDFPVCVDGICTVWTRENVTSSMDVQMRIREVSVPEPATLVLLGLGLLGLGLAKRRGIKS